MAVSVTATPAQIGTQRTPTNHRNQCPKCNLNLGSMTVQCDRQLPAERHTNGQLECPMLKHEPVCETPDKSAADIADVWMQTWALQLL